MLLLFYKRGKIMKERTEKFLDTKIDDLYKYADVFSTLRFAEVWTISYPYKPMRIE